MQHEYVSNAERVLINANLYQSKIALNAANEIEGNDERVKSLTMASAPSSTRDSVVLDALDCIGERRFGQKTLRVAGDEERVRALDWMAQPRRQHNSNYFMPLICRTIHFGNASPAVRRMRGNLATVRAHFDEEGPERHRDVD